MKCIQTTMSRTKQVSQTISMESAENTPSPVDLTGQSRQLKSGLKEMTGSGIGIGRKTMIHENKKLVDRLCEQIDDLKRIVDFIDDHNGRSIGIGMSNTRITLRDIRWGGYINTIIDDNELIERFREFVCNEITLLEKKLKEL